MPFFSTTFFNYLFWADKGGPSESHGWVEDPGKPVGPEESRFATLGRVALYDPPLLLQGCRVFSIPFAFAAAHGWLDPSVATYPPWRLFFLVLCRALPVAVVENHMVLCLPAMYPTMPKPMYKYMLYIYLEISSYARHQKPCVYRYMATETAVGKSQKWHGPAKGSKEVWYGRC